MKIRKRPIGTDKNTRLSPRGCCVVVAPGPKINADVNNSWINKCLESVSADSRLNLSSSSSYFGQKFFFFSFFSEGFLSISHRRPSITVWQNGPNNHVHPNSPHLSPPSLENVPNRPDAKVPVSLSSPIVPKGNCWKERRGGRPFWSATYYLPLLFDWSLSPLCILCECACISGCLSRMAVYKLNKLCGVGLSVCVCGKNSRLVGETERWTDASNQWMAGCGPFCFTVFWVGTKIFWFDFARAWQLQAEKMIASVSLSNTHTPREREREKRTLSNRSRWSI